MLDVLGRPDDYRPTVLVLDEFQYLADSSDGAALVASELNAVWERRQGVPPVLVVLSGSSIGTMEALAGGGGPLYGRFSWHHKLKPFDYLNAGKMVPYQDLRDRAVVYGVFGGIPQYLDALDVNHSLATNIIRLMIRPGGEVRQSVETSLDQEEGLREVSKYRGIVRAIASGLTERNDIAQRTGLKNDTGLVDKLNRLIEFGYLEAVRNFDAHPNEAIRYSISDPALRFHQRFVEPATSIIERHSPSRTWEASIAGKLNTYMGTEFERIARQGYDAVSTRLELPMVVEWSRWKGTDRGGRSMEIDLLAQLTEGRMLSGAVSWNARPLSSEVHWQHMDMLRRGADAGRKWAHRALDSDALIVYAAGGGFSQEFTSVIQGAEQRVVTLGLGELYG